MDRRLVGSTADMKGRVGHLATGMVWHMDGMAGARDTCWSVLMAAARQLWHNLLPSFLTAVRQLWCSLLPSCFSLLPSKVKCKISTKYLILVVMVVQVKMASVRILLEPG